MSSSPGESKRSSTQPELVGVAGKQVAPHGYESPPDWDEEEDLDNEEGLDHTEDKHLDGKVPERRAWSRKEDEAITRLVRLCNHASLILIDDTTTGR